jgi:CRP-like cAMP-binding protein
VIDDLLTLTEGMAERRLEAGDTVFVEGEPSRSVVVLVEGELLIESNGVVVNRHTRPGSIVGETGTLLGRDRNATVTATTPTVVREIGDPEQFFVSHPELALELARQLAGRLDRITTYVSEVEALYADRTDHLGMFGQLLGRIATAPTVEVEGGSERSPDY